MRRLILIALALGACAGANEALVPTERLNAVAMDGNPAATYDITIAGDHVGSATVSSRGAYRGDVGGHKTTLVHMGIELENTGELPLKLDTSRTTLESVRIGKQVMTGVAPVSVRGSTTIAPGKAGHVDVYFALPEKVSPDDVDAVRFKWYASNAVGDFGEMTPFVEYDWGYGYYSYYDPYTYPGYYYRRVALVEGPYWAF